MRPPTDRRIREAGEELAIDGDANKEDGNTMIKIICSSKIEKKNGRIQCKGGGGCVFCLFACAAASE